MPEKKLVVDIPTRSGSTFYTKLPGADTAFALTCAAAKADAPLFVITDSMQEALYLQQACQFFNPHLTCFVFPAWETLPYDHFSPHQSIVSDRLLSLQRLPSLTRGIVFASISTVLQKFAPKSYLAGQVFSLKQGQKFDWETMRYQLQTAGYRAVNQVVLPGEYAVRGSLFDIYPTGSQLPFRIDLFDDEIETIKRFDPETQRSQDILPSIDLLPAHEFPMNEQGIKTFREHFREAFSVNPSQCSIYEAVSRGETPPGIEYYLSLFFDTTAHIFDYLPENTIVVSSGELAALAQQEWQVISDRYAQLSHDVTRPILPPAQVFISIDDLKTGMSQFATWYWIDPSKANALQNKYLKALPFEPLPDLMIQPQAERPLERLEEFINSSLRGASVSEQRSNPGFDLKPGLLRCARNDESGYAPQKILFTAETAGRRENLIALLKPSFSELKVLESWDEFLNVDSESDSLIAITIAPLENGFTFPSGVVIPESALLGVQVMQSRRRKVRHFDTELIIRNLAELSINDPIVHIDHGIGRYHGLEILRVGEQEGEFLKIVYDGGNLYVPVSNLHLISRYTGVDSEHAPLNKLGSDQWEKAKRKASEQIRDVAAELLIIYAARAAKQGFRYTAPDEHFHAFIAAFPFEETVDQITATEAVVKDMTAEQPMDRLICGDVGFGKTEIAMRAAFLAVQSGKQVGILVPTTLLAQQHHESFCNRFADWPVKIEVLSRFRTNKEQQEVLEKLANGLVDIVIGTHKLLQSQIKFHNLGLLIVDEEHRFGVRQKEALKKLRADVDVLAMTATPIPRTLNMAMSAIRDLSIIATPPAKRLAIKTFVREFDWAVVREAIQRETARGGQVYFLHNEVANIERVAEDLRALLPEARVVVGHGQLHERELERVMADFYHQKFNVLVCSTIIETGIDVPSANTIIINRADKFGLAQLHQLRGRVGRSHHQAYAYLFTPPPKTLTPDAQKRLEAIEALEELGVGFILATHDLEIRGAGELLGESQSGNMQAIGYTLYTELLDRTVKAMQKGELSPDLETLLQADYECEIELQLAAFIPDHYLGDVNQRLIFYKRIASAIDEENLNELRAEMIDRFGTLPVQVQTLFQQMQLKWQAQALGIKRIEAHAKGGRLEFKEKNQIDPMKIIRLIQVRPHEFKLDGPNKLKFFFNEEMLESELRINAVKKILQQLM